ncbi:3'-5' exonuclease [Sulfurospirillum sp. 1307]
MRNFDNLVLNMAKNAQPFNVCKAKLEKIEELKEYVFDNPTDFIENLRLLGLPLVELNNNLIALETTFTPIEKQKFCIVDIETNGSKPSNAQIIEIGAVMVQGGAIIDKFESFVKANEIPDNIVELTNITLRDLEKAPNIKDVLAKFRLFLQDAIFVAHNVNFDYNFISYSLESAGFGPLLNRKMCTIDLAKKTIQAQKYGLSSLIEEFNIDVKGRHRAYWDAYAAKIVFDKSLENLPETIISSEDLIRFAKPNPKKRKKKTKS